MYINKRATDFNFCKLCINEIIQNDIIKAIPYLHNYRIPVCPEIWEEYKENEGETNNEEDSEDEQESNKKAKSTKK